MATMGFVVVALSNPPKNLFINFVSKINLLIRVWGYQVVPDYVYEWYRIIGCLSHFVTVSSLKWCATKWWATILRP